MQKEIRHTWYFNQPPQEVWEYLTRPELVEQWLAKTDIQPVVGHAFQFLDKTGKAVAGEVLEVKPCTRFSYSWKFHSPKDGKPYDSRVEWTLLPNEHGTELQLVHSFFRTLEDAVAHSNGWTRCLVRMIDQFSPVIK